ncbi:MAG: glucose 1-dehydrogenase [Beijerinckiaceae bacterium]|nr:glucose 1-dehydrogenase [Beijerinckiaceae bacterium]
MMRYADKAVIVTGAGSGIGKATALRFAAEGAKLVVSDLNEAALMDTADEIKVLGAAVTPLVGDVADESTAPKLVQGCLDSYGALDIAINNAGVAHAMAKLPKIPVEAMALMLRVNLMGVFLAMKAQIPVMERQGAGVILNVASVAGLIGAPLLSAYAAAKHGVIGLTKSASAESARKGVRINAVCPASTDTPMVSEMVDAMGRDPKEAVQRVVMATPMARLATVDEVVQAILWICSPENSFMTGHALTIDGGLSAI